MATPSDDNRPAEYFDAVARNVLGAAEGDEFQELAGRDDFDAHRFKEILRKNLVTVHALAGVDLSDAARWGDMQQILANEKQRVAGGLSVIQRLAARLEESGQAYAIIKTLDQYPDMGHDIDFLIVDSPERVSEIVMSEFNGEIKSPSISDRLAHKTNYRVRGYPTLEQHCGRLGQVGEERALVRGLMERRTTIEMEGQPIRVPGPEHRIILAVLQRILRHFNIRICDLVNLQQIVLHGGVDWDHLFQIGRELGLQRAIHYYLAFVDEICARYTGKSLLPGEVRDKLVVSGDRYKLHVLRDHYRFPVGKVGRSVYTAKYANHLKRFELSSALRLLLVPAFAVFTYSNIKFFPQWPVWKRLW